MEEQPIQAESMEASPEATQPPPPPDGAQAEGSDRERTLTLALGGLALVVICLCAALAFTSGLRLFGGSPDATPTPVATSTPVPTPEPGEPPTAVIDAPTRATVGEEIPFDGSNSQGASALVNFSWDFGDGTGAQGPVVSHGYAKAGQYTVTLVVTDQDGLTDSASLRIRIEEPTPTPEPAEPPTAIVQGPSEGLAGEVVTFDGRQSEGDNPLVNYAWDFGDRTQGNGAVVDHVYSQAGNYNVTLTVTDNAGLSGTASLQITITAVETTPPVGVIDGPTEAMVSQPVTFSAAQSQPGSGAIVNYAWDFGNGNSQEGRNEVEVSTRYDEPGQYQVRLVVTDENGQSSETTSQILVSAPLEGTSWYLTTVLPDTAITATFNRGQVTGSAGCNDYNSSYTVSDPAATSGTITMSPVLKTSRACPEDVLAQETRYVSSLEAVINYSISGNTLNLTFPGGVLTYTTEETTQ